MCVCVLPTHTDSAAPHTTAQLVALLYSPGGPCCCVAKELCVCLCCVYLTSSPERLTESRRWKRSSGALEPSGIPLGPRTPLLPILSTQLVSASLTHRGSANGNGYLMSWTGRWDSYRRRGRVKKYNKTKEEKK